MGGRVLALPGPGRDPRCPQSLGLCKEQAAGEARESLGEARPGRRWTGQSPGRGEGCAGRRGPVGQAALENTAQCVSMRRPGRTQRLRVRTGRACLRSHPGPFPFRARKSSPPASGHSPVSEAVCPGDGSRGCGEPLGAPGSMGSCLHPPIGVGLILCWGAGPTVLKGRWPGGWERGLPARSPPFEPRGRVQGAPLAGEQVPEQPVREQSRPPGAERGCQPVHVPRPDRRPEQGGGGQAPRLCSEEIVGS